MNAIAIENSQNSKLGMCSATYVSQDSCPSSCPLRSSGCYAEYGPLGIITRRLSKSNKTPFQLAREEARAIDRLTGDRPLRLHVVGDCRTDASAHTLAYAAKRYTKRGNKSVWTYTHSWREIKRSSWGQISVLASCDNLEHVEQARARGYATAVIVEKFTSTRTYSVLGQKIIPCPAQTKKITCRDCKLCWNDQRLLKRKLTIGFEAHGIGRRKALTVLNG